MSRRGGCFKAAISVAIPCLLLMLPQGSGAVSDVEMTGFKIIQETGGGRWEIEAGKASYDGRGDVILQEVSARMIAKGVERVRVVSDNGRYDSKGLILYLEGNVSVTSDWGSRFEAPNLRWDGPRAVMVAENGIQLKRGGLKVLGKTFRYAVDSGKAVIDGGVRTTWIERGGQR